jgi:hypothetical protein
MAGERYWELRLMLLSFAHLAFSSSPRLLVSVRRSVFVKTSNYRFATSRSPITRSRWKTDAAVRQRRAPYGRCGRVAARVGADLATEGESASATPVRVEPRPARSTAGGEFALARYDGDGSLDPTFGSGGEVLTGVGGGLRG